MNNKVIPYLFAISFFFSISNVYTQKGGGSQGGLSTCCYIELISDPTILVDLENFPHESPFFSLKINGQVETCVSSIHDLLDQSNNCNGLLSPVRKICIDGGFYFSNTITLTFLDQLVLYDDTEIRYVNTQGPAIKVLDNGTSIRGSGGEDKGKISSIALDETILIESTTNTTSFNSIEGIEITNGYNSTPNGQAIVIFNEIDQNFICGGSGDCKAGAKDDLLQVSYFNNLSDLTITNFNVGIKLKGHANANFISSIEIKDFGQYGIWLTGCADNVFKDIHLNTLTSESKYAIRLDTYYAPNAPPCPDDLENNTSCYLVSPYNNSFWNLTIEDCISLLLVEEKEDGSALCPIYNNNTCGEASTTVHFGAPRATFISYNNTSPNCSFDEVDDQIPGVTFIDVKLNEIQSNFIPKPAPNCN